MTFNEYLYLKGYSSKSIATIEKIVGYFKQWCDKENLPTDRQASAMKRKSATMIL